MALLSVDSVSKAFGKRTILDSVSLDIESKSIIAISGQTGSGKTTLLGILSGLLKPDSGRVFFKDKSLYRWIDFQRSRYRNREVGYVYQSFNLIPELTAYQNIVYPAIINRHSQKIRENVHYLVDYLGISGIIRQYPSSLSGGEKQRVAIARAIINWPSILLADEPTGNLDEHTGKKIFSLFTDLMETKNMAIIISTHDRSIINSATIHYHLENGALTLKKSPRSRRN